MICFIALFVFAIMSIFSAKYRPYARQAFDCVFRRMTLRPCNTTLEEEVKGKTVGWLLGKNPAAAKIANAHWEAISWLFTAMMLVSFAYAVAGIANFVVYGNCNGPEGGFCIYNGIANGLQNPNLLSAPNTLEGQRYGNANALVTVVEFGCFSCPYTMAAEPYVEQLCLEYGDRIYFVYKPFPLPNHPYSTEAALASICAEKQGKYWEYRKLLFQNQSDFRQMGEPLLFMLANEAGLNNTAFDICYLEGQGKAQVEKTIEEGKKSGIYGTPTFFVNGKAVVAPKSYEELKAAVDEALANAK